jgi:hypothetical protein
MIEQDETRGGGEVDAQVVGGRVLVVVVAARVHLDCCASLVPMVLFPIRHFGSIHTGPEESLSRAWRIWSDDEYTVIPMQPTPQSIDFILHHSFFTFLVKCLLPRY